MIARADAGQAGTDDQHVEMFFGFDHGVLPPHRMGGAAPNCNRQGMVAP
jgi:hypothetical protein